VATSDTAPSIRRAPRDDAGRVKGVARFLLYDFSAFIGLSFDTPAALVGSKPTKKLHLSAVRHFLISWSCGM